MADIKNGQGNIISGQWDNMVPGPYKTFPDPLTLVAEYYLMRTFEPTTKRVLALLRSLVLGKLGHYVNENMDIEEAVNGYLRGMAGGIEKVIGDLLSALWAGFAVLEPIWETDEGDWTVKRCDLLHPFTFFNRRGTGEDAVGIRLDKNEKIVKRLTQYPTKMGGGNPVTHNIEDVIYWPAFQELREQTIGCSLLASARRAWYSKIIIENYWNTFVEKCAMPTPVFRVPMGTTTDPKTGREMTWVEFFKEFFEEYIPGMAIAVPLNDDAQFDFTTMQVGSDGSAFDRITNYWKQELFNSMITPRLALEEPEHASRGQTESVMDLYYMMVDGIRLEIGQVLINQLISKMIELNFGPGNANGHWQWDPLQNQDMELLARVFETVERAKYQQSMTGQPMHPADEEKLREIFGEVYPPYKEVNGILTA